MRITGTTLVRERTGTTARTALLDLGIEGRPFQNARVGVEWEPRCAVVASVIINDTHPGGPRKNPEWPGSSNGSSRGLSQLTAP
jgi:hypothetical protein